MRSFPQITQITQISITRVKCQLPKQLMKRFLLLGSFLRNLRIAFHSQTQPTRSLIVQAHWVFEAFSAVGW